MMTEKDSVPMDAIRKTTIRSDPSVSARRETRPKSPKQGTLNPGPIAELLRPAALDGPKRWKY
jgi:hypothetical protein